MEQKKPNISSEAQLVTYCIENVQPLPGKIGSKDGPDDNTVRGAIAKYGLQKFIRGQP